jgi:hypothetical protein
VKQNQETFDRELSLAKSDVMYIIGLYEKALDDENVDANSRELYYLAKRTLGEIEAVQKNNGVVVDTGFGQRVIPVNKNMIRSFQLSAKHVRAGLPSRYRRVSQQAARKALTEDKT